MFSSCSIRRSSNDAYSVAWHPGPGRSGAGGRLLMPSCCRLVGGFETQPAADLAGWSWRKSRHAASRDATEIPPRSVVLENPKQLP